MLLKTQQNKRKKGEKEEKSQLDVVPYSSNLTHWEAEVVRSLCQPGWPGVTPRTHRLESQFLFRHSGKWCFPHLETTTLQIAQVLFRGTSHDRIPYNGSHKQLAGKHEDF